MRKVLSGLGLLAMMTFLTACPYSADFPLSEPDESVKREYLGTWGEDTGNKNASFYVITKSSDKIYLFEYNEYDSNQKMYKKTLYKGHFTKLGNVNFLNLENTENKGTFYFHKVVLSSDKKKMVVHEVTDNIDERFSNASELKAFFEKHKDLSFFYNREEKTYIKK